MNKPPQFNGSKLPCVVLKCCRAGAVWDSTACAAAKGHLPYLFGATQLIEQHYGRKNENIHMDSVYNII